MNTKALLWYINYGIQTGILVLAIVLLFYNVREFWLCRREGSTLHRKVYQLFRISRYLSIAFSIAYIVGYTALRIGYRVPGEYFRGLFLLLCLAEISRVVAVSEFQKQPQKAVRK